MRGILSKEQEEKKNKKKQIIIGSVLILIMLGSTFGIIIDSFGSKTDKNKINYNGTVFENKGGYWYAQKGGLNLIFSYNPLQIGAPEVKLNGVANFYSKPLYVYSEDSRSIQEILLNFDPKANNIVQRIQIACPLDKNCSTDYPKKDCTNNFISIKISNSSSIKQNNNCVVIEGNETEILGETDKALFSIFGF